MRAKITQTPAVEPRQDTHLEQSQKLWQTKSIHQDRFEINTYVEALEIPAQKLRETVGWMRQHVQRPTGEKLRVLVIGPGAGRLELPFIEALGETYPNIYALFIDYGQPSMTRLRDELDDRGYQVADPGSGNRLSWERRKDGVIDCRLMKEDFETWSLEVVEGAGVTGEDGQAALAQKWDVILAFFVVNFFEDWIGSLKRILALLKPEGVFFFSEDTDDIRFLDNTFVPVDEKLQELLLRPRPARVAPNRATFYRLWRKYYELRERSGHAWQPLISPSDMKVVFQALRALASLDLGTVAEEHPHPHWDTGKITVEKWLQIIRESEVFNCLSIIPSSLRSSIEQELREWLKNELGPSAYKRALGRALDIRVGHKIYLYKAPPESKRADFEKAVGYVVEAEYEKALFRTLAFRSPHLLDLSSSEIKMEDHIRRVISTRNQLPMRGHAAFSVVSWRLDDLADPSRGGWSEKVPILFPEQYDARDDRSFCVSYALYMCKRAYDEKDKSKKTLPLLSEILIHRLPINLLFEFRVGRERDTAIEFHKSGTPATLVIGLDEGKVGHIRSAAAAVVGGLVKRLTAQKDLWSPDEHDAHDARASEKFDFERLPLISFKNINRLASRIWKEYEAEICKLFDAVEEAAESLSGLIEEQMRTVAANEEKWKVDKGESIVKSLAAIAYANAVIGSNTHLPWTVASFLPAKSILQVLKNNNPWEIGLLGFICYYRPESEFVAGRHAQPTAAAPGYLALMRDLLCINVNQYGLQDAIHQYGKLVRKEAGRSATAAIMSRNMSHNIGSHVLASSDLMKGVHKIEVQKLHNFLQQRMDFIAQVVTYTPSWGEPLFFFKDLLQVFFDQYLLLNHLIKDQGYGEVRFVVGVPGQPPLVFERVESDYCRNEECRKPRWADNERDACNCEFRSAKGKGVWGKVGRWVHTPWLLAESDLKDPAGLARSLKEGRGGGDPLAEYIYEKLADETKGLLGASPSRAKLRAALVEDLNRLLLRSESANNGGRFQTFFDNGHFAGVALPEELGRVIGRGPDGEEGVRLKRLLLEAAYPAAFAKSPPRPPSPPDFLVSIPGGAIGAHAFYDILENIMRNSAKYGKKQKVFEMHIEVGDDPGRYLVSMWDTASEQGRHYERDDCPCRVCRVRGRLSDALIDAATGTVRVQSHGVHEMKECARLLAYPYPKEAGADTEEGRRWDLRAEPSTDGKIFQFWADAVGDKKKYLAHKFYLLKPRLVGVADLRREADAAGDGEGEKFGVFGYAETGQLQEHSHQFGLVFMPGERESWERTFEGLAEQQQLLPYRLLLVAEDAGECEKSLRAYAESRAAKGKSPLPARRLHCCSAAELAYPRRDGPRDWGDFILRVYEVWLRAFKGGAPGAKHHLVVAFERSEGHQSFRAWKSSLAEFRSALLDVHVIRVWPKDAKREVCDFAVEASSSGMSEGELKDEVASNPDRFLFFDNHGAAISALDASVEECGFYQPFGADNLRLHHALESPPQPGFGFGFFALALLEAALIRVVIVDERVAEAAFDNDSFMNKTLQGSLEKEGVVVNVLGRAGCYPVFSVWTECNERGKGAARRMFVSEALAASNKLASEQSPAKAIPPDEGLDLVAGADAPIKVSTLNYEERSDVKSIRGADIIVIHQGVIDRLSHEKCWEGDDIKRLYVLSPSVVITSGRGRTLRHVSNNAPFIEFATVRENTYAGLSKYHLVRALLSVMGTNEGE